MTRMNTKIYHLVEGVTPNSKAHSSLLLGLPKLTSEGMSSAELDINCVGSTPRKLNIHSASKHLVSRYLDPRNTPKTPNLRRYD